MPNSPPAAEPRKWRFSLKTLFLWTLLAAVAVWLTSWRRWDLDERILIGSWFIAVTSAITWSRLRRRRGIILSAIVGGLVPAPLVTAYYIWSDFIPFHYVPSNATFVAVGGAVAGSLLAWSFTPRGIDQLAPSEREDRLQGRLVLFVGATVLFVLSVGIWSAYRRATEWNFRGEFWPHQLVSGLGETHVEISPNGSHLLYVAPLHGERDKGIVVVWGLVPPRNKPLFEQVIANSHSWNWSHNGELIAICDVADGKATISILESDGGRRLAELAVPAKLEESEAGTFTFSLDDRLFRFVTRAGSGKEESTRLYYWRTDNWQQLAPHERDGDSQWPTNSQHPEVKIVEVEKESWRDAQTYRLEVGAPGASLGVKSYGPFETDGPVTFMSGANRIAFGSSLLDLESNTVRELPGIALAATRDGKRLLCVERNERQGTRVDFSDGPLPAFPIIQHLWLDGMHKRFILLDAEDCHVLSKSQWIRIEWGLEALSADGKIVVVGRDDWFKVWEIRN